ncbi:MAG: HD-GYP domain-containing protein [Mariprofundus sp.]
MNRQHALEDNVNEALIALVGAVEARDVHTRDQAVRVHRMVERLTNMFRMDSEQRQKICNAALIHNIGLVSVPDAILLKPGRLNEAERQVIEASVCVASAILEPIKSLGEERLLILHQGERWDGAGYPDGLKKRDIPIGSRFIAVANAIDAMTQNRAYRRARPISYCLGQLRENAGSQFDPKIAEAAAAMLCKGGRDR